MALGKEYDELWTEEDRQKLIESKGMSEPDEWLERKGLVHRVDFSTCYVFGRELDMAAGMLWGRPALLSITSLNNEHGWHMVYYDGTRVWDPQEGRPGKLFVRILRSCVIQRAFLIRSDYGNTKASPISD